MWKNNDEGLKMKQKIWNCEIMIQELEFRAMKRYLDDTDWDLILETLSEDELIELNKYYDMKGIKR